MAEGPSKSVGMVTSRKCPLCGHHEIGMTTENGEFQPLKPGTKIQVVEDSPLTVASPEAEGPYEATSEGLGADRSGSAIWIPKPLRGDKALSLKYGILLEDAASIEGMSREIYQAAYLGKIIGLLEEEDDIPLPVLLDRFFTAPHLASGDAKQIAQAMWGELNEIREPVHLMGEWLEKRDDESLCRMIHPKSREDLAAEPIGEDQLKRDLDRLSLETFLELLCL